MCTIGELVDELTERLSDCEPGYENTRWKRSLLRGYILSAVTIAAENNKEAFSSTRDIVLEDGCYHCVCDECDSLLAVISVGGENCDLPSTTSDIYAGLGSHYNHLCIHSGDSDSAADPGSVTIDSNSPCCFRTEREVEAGTVATVLCYTAINPDGWSDTTQLPRAICSRFRAAIINFAMAEARMLDSESEAGLAAARVHMEYALVALGVRSG